MSSDAVEPRGLHCRHCGREVHETLHLRSGYRVDYYTLHTGDAEPTLVAHPDGAAPPLTVWRLLHGITIVTCVDCYRLPEIQREREALFRPETVGVSPPDPVPEGKT